MKPIILLSITAFCLQMFAITPMQPHRKTYYLDKPGLTLANNNQAVDSTHKLYLLYPRIKTDKSFYVFLNGKKISKINYGERLEFEFNKELDLLTVIQETEQYVQPPTTAKNARNIFIHKNHYLQINSKGQLEYIRDEKEGDELLNENGKYVAPLKKTSVSEIPQI